MTRAAAMSNIERQRKFRLSHPGYFNKYNARRRGCKATMAKAKALRVAAYAQAAAAAAEQTAAEQAAAQTTTSATLPALPLAA